MRARCRALCVCVLIATLGVPVAPATAAAPPAPGARPLTPPSTGNPRIVVDMLNIRPPKLSWSHAGSGFVKIYPPGEVHPYPTRFPATGTFAPRTQLPIGRSTFSVSYCKRPAPRAAPLCSAGTPITYVVGPAEFRGPHRKFVPAHRNLKLSWSVSGNVWHLIAPTLGVAKWLTKPTFAIRAADMVAGVHQITLVSCSFTSRPRCSNRFDVIAAAPGTVQFTVASGARVTVGQVVGQVIRDRGRATQTLAAPRTGVFHRRVANGTRVGARFAAGQVITTDVGRTEIVVGDGASVPTWNRQDWQRAFTARTYDDSAHPTTGSPLDITFDSAGDIWRVGEFSQAIALVRDGKVTDVASPVGQVPNPAAGPTRRVAQTVGGAGPGTRRLARRPRPAGEPHREGGRRVRIGPAVRDEHVRSRSPHLDERARRTRDRYRLGGLVHARRRALLRGRPFQSQHAHQGHLSRTRDRHRSVRSRCPATTTRSSVSPTTAPRTGCGSRSLTRGVASALNWFVDDGTIACNNNLNYSNPNAVAAVSAANRCKLATQTGCIHHIALPSAAGKAGHITIDRFGGYAWFVDFMGRTAESLSARAVASLQSFPFPKSASASLFNGFPWAIQVDANAVYLNRYSDNTLMRFDKTVASPPTACTTLVGGKNPCISELFLPMPGRDANAHSLTLVGTKLWFTIANESSRPTNPNGSAFGFIDTTSWAAGTPTGTYYDNLDTLGTRPPNAHHSFRGIAVNPSGTIALADSGYKKIISLTPR